MIVHQVFAQVSDGTVRNVIVCDNYEMANYLARATYGESAVAVDCLQYPCAIGDLYHAGRFWRLNEDGAERELNYIPTQEQEVATLKEENANLTIVMADMIGGAYSA